MPVHPVHQKEQPPGFSLWLLVVNVMFDAIALDEGLVFVRGFVHVEVGLALWGCEDFLEVGLAGVGGEGAEVLVVVDARGEHLWDYKGNVWWWWMLVLAVVFIGGRGLLGLGLFMNFMLLLARLCRDQCSVKSCVS
jgi:hypothetical protein